MMLSIARTVPSILGADLKIVGNIMSEDDEVHISGMLTGDLTARKLTLAESGMIEGKIEAETVEINGNFSCRLIAASVMLGRTASVTADIIYVSMEMEADAVYDGHARRVDSIKTISAEVMEFPIPKRKQTDKARVARGG